MTSHHERRAQRRAQAAADQRQLAAGGAPPPAAAWTGALRILAAAWPGDFPQADRQVYATLLADLGPDRVAAAAARLSAAGNRFRPTPGELREEDRQGPPPPPWPPTIAALTAAHDAGASTVPALQAACAPVHPFLGVWVAATPESLLWRALGGHRGPLVDLRAWHRQAAAAWMTVRGRAGLLDIAARSQRLLGRDQHHQIGGGA